MIAAFHSSKQGKLGQWHTQFLNIMVGKLTQSQQGRSQQVWESTTHQHPRAHKATHNSSMQTLRKVTHPQSKVEAEFGLTTASQIMGKQQQPKTYTAAHSRHGKNAPKSLCMSETCTQPQHTEENKMYGRKSVRKTHTHSP